MKKDIYHFVLAGKAKDVFKELEFMAQLEKATGCWIAKYTPELPKHGEN